MNDQNILDHWINGGPSAGTGTRTGEDGVLGHELLGVGPARGLGCGDDDGLLTVGLTSAPTLPPAAVDGCFAGSAQVGLSNAA